ncbi:MAG: hypothetical protein R3316_03975 [Rhodovibrionaceae bacterium]|nr:hypothetical protein [Rhodovibrionaceae bacterium]
MRIPTIVFALLVIAIAPDPARGEVASHRALYELDTNGESTGGLEITGAVQTSLALGCGYIRQEFGMMVSAAVDGQWNLARDVYLNYVIQESSDHRRGSGHFSVVYEAAADNTSVLPEPIAFDFTYERMEDGALLVEHYTDDEPFPKRQRADVLTPIAAYLEELDRVRNGSGEWAIRYFDPMSMSLLTRRFSPPQPQPLPRGVEDPDGILDGQKHWEYMVEEIFTNLGSVPARYGLSGNGVMTLMSFDAFGLGALQFRLTRVEDAPFPGCG